MKELKDYLHLYTGCRVMINPEMSDSNIAVFIGFKDEHKLSAKVRFRENTPDGQVNLLFLKPILRPLLTMTAQEAAEYADFYQNSPIPDECTIEVKPKDGFVHVSIISPDGSSGMSLFPGGPHGDKAEAFRYLLSRRFDLFGLIQSGLAVTKIH